MTWWMLVEGYDSHEIIILALSSNRLMTFFCLVCSCKGQNLPWDLVEANDALLLEWQSFVEKK